MPSSAARTAPLPEAVGQRLGSVEIANGDREPARATALRGLTDAADVTGIGGSHRREQRRRVYPTASPQGSSAAATAVGAAALPVFARSDSETVTGRTALEAWNHERHPDGLAST